MEWITCANPDRERWRHLLEFANEDLAIQAIVGFHGADASQRRNYKKQASQIRVALLQAREYFQAAEESSAFTAANHIYYGAISLASAIMLVRGDGTRSLDVLRRNPVNRSHGLHFSESLSVPKASHGTGILEGAFVSVRVDGHFRNWYSCLPNIDTYGFLRRMSSRQGLVSTSLGALASMNVCVFEALTPAARPVMSLLNRLPDLMFDLRRFGVRVVASPVTVDREVDTESESATMRFRVHGASDDRALEEILDGFLVHPEHHERVSWQGYERGGIIQFGHGAQFRFPEVRMTIDGESVVYAEDPGVPEVADAYCVSFGLSMLARYFPDYWIACLESHCVSAKLIERFVDVYLRKFPMLALWYLRGPVVFSTQPAPYRT